MDLQFLPTQESRPYRVVSEVRTQEAVIDIYVSSKWRGLFSPPLFRPFSFLCRCRGYDFNCTYNLDWPVGLNTQAPMPNTIASLCGKTKAHNPTAQPDGYAAS